MDGNNKILEPGTIHGPAEHEDLIGVTDLWIYHPSKDVWKRGLGRVNQYFLALIYSTDSKGKLAFLKNVISFFKVEVDAEGNFLSIERELK